MLPDFLKKFKNNEVPIENTEKISGPTNVLGADIRYILSIIVFVFTTLFLGALYVTEYYFELEVEKSGEEITRLQNEISQNDIKVLSEFDSQVKTVRLSSEDRSGYRILLDEISKIVVPGVRYTSAEISLQERGLYKVSINAVATSLIVYLQQVAVLSSLDGVLSNITLYDYKISRKERGNTTVTFVLEKSIPIQSLFQNYNDENIEQNGEINRDRFDENALDTLNI